MALLLWSLLSLTAAGEGQYDDCSSATASAVPLAGMWAGYVDASIQGSITGDSSSVSRLLGAGFGFIRPSGAAGSLAGGGIGYAGAKALGYDDHDAGSAYLAGSLVGGTLAGGVAAWSRQSGSLIVRGTYAAQAMSPDVVLGGAGFAAAQEEGVGTEHVVATTPVFPCKTDIVWLVCSVFAPF